MNQRTVAIFTGNRAEFGLLYPILKAIRAHPGLSYRLIVSAAHLDTEFGSTIKEIRAGGFDIHAEATLGVPDGTMAATARAIGSGILSISAALEALRPDLMIVYGDRFESFAAAIAATQMNIPTAHVEGGDLTEGGALDDSVRHAITKLAHLHFTTNQQATNRVLAMGEEPWRVVTAGLPAIDAIIAGDYAGAEEVDRQLGLDPLRPVVVFTQHSVTTETEQVATQVLPSLKALRHLSKDGVQVIATYPNNDDGGRLIITLLREIAELPGFQVVSSLGRHLYHGILSLALNPMRRVACIGNSSSGIKETPAFGCPTVNIGSRQDGRLRAGNTIDVPYDAEAIYSAVRRCLDDSAFRARCRRVDNPYGNGNAGKTIAEFLASVPLDRQKLLRKGMTLRGENRDGWFH